MKPVSLRLENFRSYRSSEPIEFGDAALVGVVGPTGAGKSSILEAMIYALYGERSDSKQKQDELIAFNERGMAVNFHFSVHGQEYQLYRSRRNGLAVQRLTLDRWKSCEDPRSGLGPELLRRSQFERQGRTRSRRDG